MTKLWGLLIICIVAVGGNPEGQSNVKSCGYEKECVQRYLCNNGSIIKDGRAIFDMRTAIVPSTSNQGCHWTEICCAINDKISRREEEYVSQGCGYRNKDGLEITLSNRMTNESQFGEFPWIISVWEDNIFRAGGSLLAPNVVLTSAHNVQNSSIANLMVRAGEWDMQSTKEPYAHQDRFVKDIIFHPNYLRIPPTHDAAILILKRPFKLAPHIDTVCLPDRANYANETQCYVMGWGKKQRDDTYYPNLLKKIQMPVVRNILCQRKLRREFKSREFELHNSFMCAGGGEYDACLGDGGSPLVCPIGGSLNRFAQVGIVSWGVQCGKEDLPGVYVNVPYIQSWIEQQLHLHRISN